MSKKHWTTSCYADKRNRFHTLQTTTIPSFPTDQLKTSAALHAGSYWIKAKSPTNRCLTTFVYCLSNQQFERLGGHLGEIVTVSVHEKTLDASSDMIKAVLGNQARWQSLPHFAFAQFWLLSLFQSFHVKYQLELFTTNWLATSLQRGVRSTLLNVNES